MSSRIEEQTERIAEWKFGTIGMREWRKVRIIGRIGLRVRF